jgi:amyloid beta precursor protein binding protein 1
VRKASTADKTYSHWKTSSISDEFHRLWGSGGQQALESAHILLVNASAVGCEILKNLVLPGTPLSRWTVYFSHYLLRHFSLCSRHQLYLTFFLSIGIGQFTVIDQGTVTQSDIGSNFFLDADSLGKSRAERAAELLGELNEDVCGHWIAKDILSLLTENPSFLSQFSMVIASDITRQTAEKVSSLCWANQHAIPFIWVKTIGLLGAARVVLPEHVSTFLIGISLCGCLTVEKKELY